MTIFDLTTAPAPYEKYRHALGKGALPALETLWLNENQIGDAGLSALASACASGALPKLTELYLQWNKIRDTGMAAFADALSKGALDHLTVCWLPTTLYTCPETCHAHSSDPEVLFGAICRALTSITTKLATPA